MSDHDADRAACPQAPAAAKAGPRPAMFATVDPVALAQEKAELAELAAKPFHVRWWGYARRTGPGWLQSAMTLGGGTATTSLTIGAVFGYELLWVQPIAMLLGVVMMSAMSYQTLSTRQRPFLAMKQYCGPGIGPFLAWAWVIGSILATIIWHFPQYALSAGMLEDMCRVVGWVPAGSEGWAGTPRRTAFLLATGVVILAFSAWITWNYSKSNRGVRLYEKAMKWMVWIIILAFIIVIARTAAAGKVDWGKVLMGFVPQRLPKDPKELETIFAAFGAAVGINMTFLYPYSQLARGWGREHRGLARFDLITGMFIPFTVAVTLMSLAAACTLHGTGEFTTKVQPIQAAAKIADVGAGPWVGRVIFGLGILGMTLSSIITHMLVASFAACEAFGIPATGWKYKLACLIPAPGMLGVIVWEKMGFWVAIRASAICGLMLPFAYFGFLILHNRKAYLGDDKPRGLKAVAWNVGMGLATGVTLGYIAYFLYHNYNKILSF